MAVEIAIDKIRLMIKYTRVFLSFLVFRRFTATETIAGKRNHINMIKIDSIAT